MSNESQELDERCHEHRAESSKLASPGKRRALGKALFLGATGSTLLILQRSEFGAVWHAPIVRSVLLPAHAQTSVAGPVTPQPPALTGNIRITSILWRQDVNAMPIVDEYVDFENIDTVPIDIGNWTLMDSGPFTLTFPSRVIQPGESCRAYVHAVPGLQACEFSFGRTSPGSAGNYVFNNGGDSANLRDASGTLIDFCSYTSAAANPVSCL